MTNSNPFLKLQLNRPLNWLIFGLLILSFIGLIDASYLAAKYYLGKPITCLVFAGCDAVASSPFASFAGIPIALPGAIYYATVFFLAVLYLDIRKSWVIRLIVPTVLAGFGVSLYLTYLQVFVIKAVCFYCVVSATDSTLLFVLSVLTMRKLEKNESEIAKN